MNNTIISHLGTKLELDDNGVTIISAAGELMRLDSDGRLIRKEAINSASYFEYFSLMGKEEQEIAKTWYSNYKQKNIELDEDSDISRFFELLDIAVNEVNNEYYIANIEPSVDEEGNLYYKSGDKVATGYSSVKWEAKAKKFSPEYGSALATDWQYVLWLAYRIAKGDFTLEYVCEDSSSQGNYWNSPNSKQKLEVSGIRSVGSARDGIGNTRKIVASSFGFSWFGGCYIDNGDDSPVIKEHDVIKSDMPISNASPVVVLNKVRKV